MESIPNNGFVKEGPVFRSFNANDFEKRSSLYPEEGLPPFPPGGYVEPHYNFELKSDPSPLFGKMLKTLQGLDIECEVEPHKFRIKCIVYRESDGSSANFNARLFQSVAPGSLVLECQKRKGCCRLFSETYRKFQSSMCNSKASPIGSSDSIAVSNSYTYYPQPSDSFNLPLQVTNSLDEVPSALPSSLNTFDLSMMLPPLDLEPPSFEETKDLHTNLLQMAKSNSCDIQLECFNSLVEQTVNCSTDCAQSLKEVGAVEFFVSCLDAESPVVDDECRRCAVMAIANLAQERDLALYLSKNNSTISSLFALAKNNKASKRTIREVVRALFTLAPYFRDSMPKEDYVSEVNKLFGSVSADSKAREMLDQLASPPIVSF